VAARKAPLRAVGKDEAPPRPKSLLEAVDTGDYLAELKATHQRIAKTVNSVETSPRDLASLTRRQLEISKEIRALELARHLVIPQGIVTTGWPQVEAKGCELGIGFDWWQCLLGRVVLGKRADGKYAATVGGVVISIPRQVGKTYFVGALIIILCILFPGLQVVWTAHRTRTATRTFRSLQGMVKRKRVKPYLAAGRNDGIRTANGEQEIAFRNGSMIMFGAREQGFGRGFDEVDIEVFDEAQILTEKALEDMVAATNQARHPHGARDDGAHRFAAAQRCSSTSVRSSSKDVSGVS